MSHLDRFSAHSLLIGATRYYTGRCTIGASEHARRLADAWPDIPDHTQRIIRRDLEDVFEQDDAARANGSDYKPLGMDCDRAAWEEVRQAWARE